MSRSIFAAFLAVLFGVVAGASGQTIWHVDDDATAGGAVLNIADPNLAANLGDHIPSTL